MLHGFLLHVRLYWEFSRNTQCVLLQMARVGLTETVKADKRKFELWLHGRSEVYVIQVSPGNR